ncbi:UDP-glucose/GDP-mannose dehydrogenase family protein [Streptomyces somaliensis]|nr:UDP-glucose/GDP-mannose dehydrogenase family protein [Streptomyces somaliensis]MCP9975860.1 UDP-glucose/GDP-mannose dehydrogenase family protein [Streptomyces somaliensis]
MDAGQLHGLFPGVRVCADVRTAVRGARAVVVLTEWPEAVEADWADLAAELVAPAVIVDGRNRLPPERMAAPPLAYRSMGNCLPSRAGTALVGDAPGATPWPDARPVRRGRASEGPPPPSRRQRCGGRPATARPGAVCPARAGVTRPVAARGSVDGGGPFAAGAREGRRVRG